MSIHEEDFVIINKEDVSDETIPREFEKENNSFDCSEHLSNSFISNDEAIARELQNQINREYNEDLKRFESGTSKLIISYEKYRKNDYCLDEYCEEDYDEFDPPDDVDWNRSTLNSVPSCGYLFNKDGTIVTKHNVSLNGQRNMKKLMSLPPNIQTGDTSHTEISNSVLNGLKHHSQNKMHDESNKDKDYPMQRKLNHVSKVCITGLGFDSYTNHIVRELLRGTYPCLQRVNGKLCEGYESVIYCAEKASKLTYNKHSNCILKLFRFNFLYFHGQEHYLADDYRYKNRYNPKMSVYNMICLWAEKERDNLELLKKYKILCPEPIKLKNNVLVMSLIGRKGKPAKKLGQTCLTPCEYFSVYQQIAENMKIMYKKARLVHADLSECNILWHNQKCYFIDVSKAVDIAHVDAFEYLKRDCRNMFYFFNRKKTPDMMSEEQLFKYITGKDWNDKVGLTLLTKDLKEKLQSSDHKYKQVRSRVGKAKLVGV